MQNAHDTATAELNLIPTPAVSSQEGLTLVKLADVVAEPQVRTETGWSESSLAELAESIKTHGLLQLPLLRNRMKPDGLYTIVAGHRRIEAMRRAGFESFYAIVGNATQAQADVMQLIENIQREQLSTKETAYALRKMADEGKTLAQIANVVKKSKPWVCKHLAVTHPEFGQYAKHLFERGEVEDVEILNGLSQLEKLIGQDGCKAALPSSGKWTRKAVKDALKNAQADQNGSNEDEEEGEEDHEQNAADEQRDALQRLHADLGEQMSLIIPALENAWHCGDIKDAQSLVNELGNILHSHATGKNRYITTLFELVIKQTKDDDVSDNPMHAK